MERVFNGRSGKGPCCLSGLRVRDAAVVAVMAFVAGLPTALTLACLLRAEEQVFSLLSSRFAVGADSFTAGWMALCGTALGLGMLAGDRFLRRFLRPPD